MDDLQYSEMSWNKGLKRWWLSQVQCEWQYSAVFVAKISWTFDEQHGKSKQQNRVGPTSTELLLALCWLLTVRSKMLCNLESFMTLNLLDAEFLHCSFLVSYLFLIHFVYSSSVRWKILLGFLCRNRLLLTGTPIQNSMAEVCPITLLEIFYPPPHACCLFSI